METRNINGEPGIVAYSKRRGGRGNRFAAWGDSTTRVYVVADPRKLKHVKRALAG